jgi:hypothetical protein
MFIFIPLKIDIECQKTKENGKIIKIQLHFIIKLYNYFVFEIELELRETEPIKIKIIALIVLCK